MKITANGVVIEGTREELQDTLNMLLERAATQWEAIEQAADETVMSNTPQQTVPMTIEEFRHMWPQLSTGSRTVLAEVATRPQGYLVADLLARLGVDGPHLGGMLSSLGIAIKRLPGKQDPLVRDWVAGQYRLPPDIAAVIRELA
ncbi:MAG TPA: hypothetical protein VGR57_20020 [Ktedonobacterales bacterium]|nr:hypothetical protein [Ktedonobacterales bacterium]